MFDTVIAAIDGTRASFEAGRQAGRLTRPDGELTLLAVVDPSMVTANQWGAGRLVRPDEAPDAAAVSLAEDRLRERAGASLRAMRAQLPDGMRVSMRVEHGRPWEALRGLAVTLEAGLIAVGSSGGRRMFGIALGGTATEVLHDTPCAVLVARPPYDPNRFPARVVVGVDGSAHSLAALDAARALVADAPQEPVVEVIAAAGSGLGADGIERLAHPFTGETRDDGPVDALVEAAASADLLIVGARGVTGLRALGSVSERVAHRAESSVLIVRSES